MLAVWKWLDGKKSAIGATAGVLLAWMQARGMVDQDTAMVLASILTIWTGVAVGHKLEKAGREE